MAKPKEQLSEFEKQLQTEAQEMGSPAATLSSGPATVTDAGIGVGFTEVEECYPPKIERAANDNKPIMSLEEALKSDKPDARQAVSEHFRRSNMHTAAPQPPQWFKVIDVDPKTRATRETIVQAVDAVDAMAHANTKNNCATGPAGKRVIKLAPQYAESA